MVICPFLTTADEKVECFSDCVFSSNSKMLNDCPFKAIERDGGFRSSRRREADYDLRSYRRRNANYLDDDFEYGDLNII